MIALIDNGHGRETKGKRSPDGRFLEYAWTREIAKRVVQGLKDMHIDAYLLVPETRDVSLKERVRRVNYICDAFSPEEVILVSIHVNAAGMGDQWHQATGWSAYTSRGQTKADVLANEFYMQAGFLLKGHKIRKDYTDGDPDLESGFYILRHTRCPAILTENGYMDCEESLQFLESEEGKDTIVRLHVDAISSYELPY